MAYFLLQHVCHAVGRGPHAFADLRLARKTAGEADLDVAIFIGLNPVGRLHLTLADHHSGLHRRVHLVSGTVEEAGIDEDDAVRSEEHTSELQSLMRISYAVFCLKKK